MLQFNAALIQLRETYTSRMMASCRCTSAVAAAAADAADTASDAAASCCAAAFFHLITSPAS
jgi:hypothetical protein